MFYFVFFLSFFLFSPVVSIRHFQGRYKYRFWGVCLEQFCKQLTDLNKSCYVSICLLTLTMEKSHGKCSEANMMRSRGKWPVPLVVVKAGKAFCVC